MKKILFPALLFVILLTGCVHKTPFTTEYFYQALGVEGEIVMTADMERIKSGELDEIIDESVKTNSMVKKATRISASLLKEENEEGAYYVTSGAVEGDISRFWINTGLSLSSAFSKEKEEDAVWYSDAEGSLSLYVPQNGVLLLQTETIRRSTDVHTHRGRCSSATRLH